MMEKAEEGQQRPAAGGARVVHSQVRRIKQEEDERAKVHETYQHRQASEMRLVVLRGLGRQQRSRSPLGRVVAAAMISIGGDS